MCRAVAPISTSSPRRQARATGPSGSITCAVLRQLRDEPRRQQQQPASDHHAAQPRRQAHADEGVAQPAGSRHPPAGLQQITQAEELQQRQRRQHRQAHHQHRRAEQPFQRRSDNANDPPGQPQHAAPALPLLQDQRSSAEGPAAPPASPQRRSAHRPATPPAWARRRPVRLPAAHPEWGLHGKEAACSSRGRSATPGDTRSCGPVSGPAQVSQPVCETLRVASW